MPGRLNRLMLLLSIPWTLLLFAALAFDWNEAVFRTLIRASAAYPAVYLGSAWVLSLLRRGSDSA
jgi:hypothetical protein